MKYKLAKPYVDKEQLKCVEEVLLSGNLVQGEFCIEFEERLGEYLNTDGQHVAVTSSGTASLHVALMALGLKEGESVLVPNFTFPATVNVVEQLGAKPIFVDVDKKDYIVHIDKIKAVYMRMKDKNNIKGIIIVHEFGMPSDMNAINLFAKGNDLFVVEDAACALGTELNGEKVGLLSDIGCFSFHPRKAITTGEGGAIVSRSKTLIEKCKILRNHGISKVDGMVDFVLPGLNYRMTNFQAALGIPQLKYFNQWIQIRRDLQMIYRESITCIGVQHPLEYDGHTWQSYMLVLDENIDRDKLIVALREHEIESNYGAYAILDTKYYMNKYSIEYPTKLSISTELYERGICLPLHQALVVEDIQHISEVFVKLVGELYEG